MARVAKDDNYLAYLKESKSDLALPDFDEDGKLIIHPGEVYCRISGCDNKTRFSNRNNLCHHISKAHPEAELVESKGGRPSRPAEDAAIRFYTEIIEALERVRSAAPKPPLPRKRDGTVNAAEMRRQMQEKGWSVPCEDCKSRKLGKKCCSEATKESCAFFDEFAEEEGTSLNEMQA